MWNQVKITKSFRNGGNQKQTRQSSALLIIKMEETHRQLQHSSAFHHNKNKGSDETGVVQIKNEWIDI